MWTFKDVRLTRALYMMEFEPRCVSVS